MSGPMTFDPYHKWLGIPPKDQPPNHYRLLAIDLFESDPEVIDSAANRQMGYLQQRAHGKYANLSQKLLTEISAARLCLLNPKKKAKYDRRLRKQLSEMDAAHLRPTTTRSAVTTPETEPLRASQSRRRITPWHIAVAVLGTALLATGYFFVSSRFPSLLQHGDNEALTAKPSDVVGKTMPDEPAVVKSAGPHHQRQNAVLQREPPGVPNDVSVVESQSTPYTLRLPEDPILVMTFEAGTLHEVERGYHVGDLSGRRLQGKGSGIRPVEGKVGAAVRLEDGATLVIPGTFPTGRQSRSLSMWLRNAAPHPIAHHIVVVGKNEKNRYFGIMAAEGKWRFSDFNGGMDSGVSVDTAWHHHCLVYDGTTLSYFIDGRLASSCAKTLDTAAGPLFFGGHFVSGRFAGDIDEVAFYDRLLEPEDVQCLYQMGNEGTPLLLSEAAHGQ
jgi:hypothetical protein